MAFADASPFPPPESLYDDVYVLGREVEGWYSVDVRTPVTHRGEDERQMLRAELPGSDESEPPDSDSDSGAGPADEAQGRAARAGRGET